MPVLKATFPSSLVFSALVRLSSGSGSGLGVRGGGVGGGEVVIGGGDEVGGGGGVSDERNMFELDPDA